MIVESNMNDGSATAAPCLDLDRNNGGDGIAMLEHHSELPAEALRLLDFSRSIEAELDEQLRGVEEVHS